MNISIHQFDKFNKTMVNTFTYPGKHHIVGTHGICRQHATIIWAKALQVSCFRFKRKLVAINFPYLYFFSRFCDLLNSIFLIMWTSPCPDILKLPFRKSIVKAAVSELDSWTTQRFASTCGSRIWLVSTCEILTGQQFRLVDESNQSILFPSQVKLVSPQLGPRVLLLC